MANGLGLVFPFSTNNTKGHTLDLNSNSNQKVKSDLFFFLTTPIGTRYRNPDFGCNFLKFFYESNDDITISELKQEIKKFRREIMKFEELEEKVINWGAEKGILDKATPLAQCNKTFEEVEELKEALEAQEQGLETFINSKGVLVNTDAEIKDAFGDIVVTVILGCKLQGLDFTDCLESAYNVISKRTGKMVNGQFVKDGH